MTSTWTILTTIGNAPARFDLCWQATWRWSHPDYNIQKESTLHLVLHLCGNQNKRPTTTMNGGKRQQGLGRTGASRRNCILNPGMSIRLFYLFYLWYHLQYRGQKGFKRRNMFHRLYPRLKTCLEPTSRVCFTFSFHFYISNHFFKVGFTYFSTTATLFKDNGGTRGEWTTMTTGRERERGEGDEDSRQWGDLRRICVSSPW